MSIIRILVYIASKYTNPVVNSNHPDPGVLALPNNQGFVAVSTSDHVEPRSKDPVFPILYSPNLVNWELVSLDMKYRNAKYFYLNLLKRFRRIPHLFIERICI